MARWFIFQLQSQIQKKMFEELSEALSIKFSHSEDQQFDMHSSPEKDKQSLKVKCFKCYGTNQGNCQECYGTSMVSANHPLAKLLDKILVRKLNLSKSEDDRSEQLERVCPIKQQEEDSDQKKAICKYCSKQVTYTCIESSESLLEKVCQGCINKDAEIDQNQALCDSVKFKLGSRQCKHCECLIQNCYSICKTCQQVGIQYWICDQCSDNQSYKHHQQHLLEPVFNYQPIQRRISMVSQIFIEEQRESMYNLQELISDNQLQHPVLSITSSIEFNRKTLERSSVKVQLDGLFNSYHLETDIKSTILKNHNENRQSFNQPLKKVKFCNGSSSGYDQKENLYYEKECSDEDYLFTDYRCDYCTMEPIVNIRYHCKLCQDFDLCQKCFKSKSLHEHDSFDKIDGRLIRQKAMQKLLQYKEIGCLSHTQTGRHKKIGRQETLRQLYGTSA